MTPKESERLIKSIIKKELAGPLEWQAIDEMTMQVVNQQHAYIFQIDQENAIIREFAKRNIARLPNIYHPLKQFPFNPETATLSAD